VITYPAELPVSQRRDDILAAISGHQVVIVSGETGSGKTTQLPKMCLELGRGVDGVIGHTQPRRIAARAVAERISDELGVELGQAVGYTVRFTDQVSDSTSVRLMTDGILLAEIQRDPMLRRYDTLIIDEAHERSLNIDFILGYCRQLLPRRPDLKLVITSATIDSQRFSEHFGGAPVIEVSGRTYPVEVRYRPVVDPDDPEADPDRDQTSAIADAVVELQREGDGDILVFLSGEREIRDTADALADLRLRDTEVLPLYARLSAAEQHRVFASHRGRRVVLATNVAETSLTVPGIRYVVDPGTARISRYSVRTKVQRLPIEAVSQASANQRAGRCGRVADGICIRLYTQDDFESRPPFTDPEILRTNLASVILQMTAIGLGDVAAFPFVEPPDRRNVRDGVALLDELGALRPAARDATPRLSDIGRRLARLPLDPRLARMVLEADRLGCVHEVLVIASAMSIQDPRERPTEHQQAADASHARFADERSDFLAYLKLWEYLAEQQDTLSSSAFRRRCRAEYLHHLRIREWQDLYSQLRRVVRQLDISLSRTGEPDADVDTVAVHTALLPGLLSHLGMKDERTKDYLGARGTRFSIFPGSSLARRQPAWVMAAELVETSRLFGRTVARVDPAWVEPLAGHLLRRTYSEPHWEARRGEVVAVERATLYGLPVVANRKTGYGRIAPDLSRELFIRHALVEGDWRTGHDFFAANRRLLEDVGDLEHRSRRRDIVVDDEALFEFYDRRVPSDVVSARHFDSWWKKARRTSPDLLTFTEDDVVDAGAARVTQADFPDAWQVAGQSLRLSYRFEPGAPDDGVTVTVPAAVLNQVPAGEFDWQVPGLRHEWAVALIRSLPKPLRRHLVPAPDTASAALERLQPGTEPFLPAFARELSGIGGVPVPVTAFDLDAVPAHLRVTVRVVDDREVAVSSGKDQEAVEEAAAPTVQEEISRVARELGLETDGLTSWSVGTLPRVVDTGVVTGYPALLDRGGHVDVRVLATREEQAEAMRTGTRRLLRLAVPASAKALAEGLSSADVLALARAPHGSVPLLLADVADAVVDGIVAAHGGPAFDAAGFAELERLVRRDLRRGVAEACTVVMRILLATRSVERHLGSVTALPVLASVTDAREHLQRLVHPGFVTAAGVGRLRDVLRYCQGIDRRLDALAVDPHRDVERMWQVHQAEQAWRATLDELGPHAPGRAAADDVRWMLEELRVSLFAQALGTPRPISRQRIDKALAAARAA
jgi:ATP-dependent helicase HrpA